jgi:hypothetical protein
MGLQMHWRSIPELLARAGRAIRGAVSADPRPYPKRVTTMPNQFAHIELTTSDLKKAKQFYQKLFDWKLTDMPMGDGQPYTMIAVGTGPGG